jgi:hypothetical protein
MDKAGTKDGRPREELIEEGEQVSQMIEFASVVPEREALPFFIISQRWYTRWQKYTGCFKVDDGEDSNDDEVFRKPDKSKVILGPHPGEINVAADLKDILTRLDDVAAPQDDIYGNFYIKAGAKEG